MEGLRARYGAGPLHLLAAIASFAVATYAFLEIADGTAPLSFVLWFAGAVVAHDLLAFPLYSLLGLIAGGASQAGGELGRRTLNHVRIPALLSAFAFVVWFPFILGVSEATYADASGRSTDPYLGRWLLLTAGLFAISALVLALRLRRARARDLATDPPGPRNPR